MHIYSSSASYERFFFPYTSVSIEMNHNVESSRARDQAIERRTHRSTHEAEVRENNFPISAVLFFVRRKKKKSPEPKRRRRGVDVALLCAVLLVSGRVDYLSILLHSLYKYDKAWK